MKIRLKSSIVSIILTAVFCLASRNQGEAQTFKVLHSFTVGSGDHQTNSDGASPYAGLVLSPRHILYGTATQGGVLGYGTVFSINPDGSGFTNLYNFSGGDDGAYPDAGLLLAGDTLYGTTVYGGTRSNGMVFKINIDGSGFTNLYSFLELSTNAPYNNVGGCRPEAGLVLLGDTLYGTATYGGDWVNGTIFSIRTNGMDFTVLHNFSLLTDGGYSLAGLISSGNTLYGTTTTSGNTGTGTLFKINNDGTGFTVLHYFSQRSNDRNPDGAYPEAELFLSGDTLYGTAREGGAFGYGTVFKVKIDGTGFITLHSFAGPIDDGFQPESELILQDNTLYGTTRFGGNSRGGTVFSIQTDGSDYKILHNFNADDANDGVGSRSGLILFNNTLFGTTYSGGTSGRGAVFSLSLPSGPQLTITSSGSNVILSWSTNAVGFTLQSTTNLVSPAVWTPVSGAIVIGGQYLVVSPISGLQKFFRLKK